MKPRLLFFEEVSKIQYTTITSCADSSLKDARYLIRHFYNMIFLHSFVWISQRSSHETRHYAQKCSSNLKWACILFPKIWWLKSCIMHVQHNDIHNEHRAIVLRGGRIMMETRLEFNQWGRHGNGGEAGVADQTVDQFGLAGLNCGLSNLYLTNWKDPSWWENWKYIYINFIKTWTLMQLNRNHVFFSPPLLYLWTKAVIF